MQVKVGVGTHLRFHRDSFAYDLAELHQLDTDLTRDFDFRLHATLEGYIIEFATKKHHSFSRVEEIFKYG